MGKRHDEIAEFIAKKEGAEYHGDKGVDIRTKTRVIEVGVHESTLPEEIRQVEGSTKARYVAVPKRVVGAALDATQGTGIGVMNDRGRIIKRGTGRGK